MKMNRKLLLLLMGLVLVPTLCRGGDDGYGFPITDSYSATIMGAPEQCRAELPKEVPTRKLLLDLTPGMAKPDFFFYDEGLLCSLVYQKKEAPLIFVIAGTGASYNSPKMISLAKHFYKAGFHVISLSSPTQPNFIVNASRSHVPGDLAEDATDLYRAMEAAWEQVKDDIQVSGFYLAGYSLGGTEAAFVAKLDEERKSFRFRKVLMINPAVNLYDSVSRIDALLDNIPGGPKKIGAFFNSMLEKFVQFYQEGEFVDITNEFLYEVCKAKVLNQDEEGGLIGLSFRFSSAEMIFVSDVLTHGGYVVPKNRNLKYGDSMDDYFWVSVHLSFMDYFNEYFFPHQQKKRADLTREELIQSLGLKKIEEYLKSSPKFGVMTNENDFILSQADREYLRQLFGERTRIYPTGGHCGNLEYRDNMAHMTEFFGISN